MDIWRPPRQSDWSQDQACLYFSSWIFLAVEKTASEKKFSCFSVRVEACCTGLPAGLPINENPGEPGLQSAASDGHRHTPRGHNLNYMIWTLYAESVSSHQCHTPLGAPWPIGAHPFQSIRQLLACPDQQRRALFNQQGNFGRALTNRGAPFPIYRATLGAPFPINQTVCKELRVDGGIAKPGLVKDTCTTVVLVSCMSSSKPRYWRGSVVIDRSLQHESQAPALLLQQQVLGALLFPKKETELGHTHFSSACFLHVKLETPVLTGMCSRRQITTNTSPRRPPFSFNNKS